MAFQPVFLRYFNHQTVGLKSGQVAAFQSLYPQILKLAYNVLMTFHSAMNIHMGVDGMNVTARSYAIQIANFSYCVGAALAQANAIMTGWRIGAKEV